MNSIYERSLLAISIAMLAACDPPARATESESSVVARPGLDRPGDDLPLPPPPGAEHAVRLPVCHCPVLPGEEAGDPDLDDCDGENSGACLKSTCSVVVSK